MSKQNLLVPCDHCNHWYEDIHAHNAMLAASEGPGGAHSAVVAGDGEAMEGAERRTRSRLDAEAVRQEVVTNITPQGAVTVRVREAKVRCAPAVFSRCSDARHDSRLCP